METKINVYLYGEKDYLDDVAEYLNKDEDNDMFNVFVLRDKEELKKIKGGILVYDVDIKNFRNFDIEYRRTLKVDFICVSSWYWQTGFSYYPRVDVYYKYGLYMQLKKSYNNFKELQIKKKFHHDKKIVLEEIYLYIKRRRHFTLKQISKEFNLPVKTTRRYILDVNSIYNVIGYDKYKNEYYMCK